MTPWMGSPDRQEEPEGERSPPLRPCSLDHGRIPPGADLALAPRPPCGRGSGSEQGLGASWSGSWLQLWDP